MRIKNDNETNLLLNVYIAKYILNLIIKKIYALILNKKVCSISSQEFI